MAKLVHIIRIEEIDTSKLYDMEVLGPHLCRLKSNVNFKKINICGLVEVTEEDNYENNEQTWTTTIKYTTKDKKTKGNRRKAYRLTSVDGTVFIVGTYERPYPVEKESNPYPSKETGSTLRTVTVTWKAPYGLLYVRN